MAAADLRGEHLLYPFCTRLCHRASVFDLRGAAERATAGYTTRRLSSRMRRLFWRALCTFTEEHALDFAAYSAFNYVMSIETGFAYGSYIIQVAICAREEAREVAHRIQSRVAQCLSAAFTQILVLSVRWPFTATSFIMSKYTMFKAA